MAGVTRGTEEFFVKKLAQVLSCQEEVARFGKCLSKLGRKTLGDPTFSYDSPAYKQEQEMFGYDLKSDGLKDFAGVVTPYINKVVEDNRISCIFDGSKPPSVMELIDEWSGSYIYDSQQYAKTYWARLMEAVTKGGNHAKMFTAKVAVPITFEQAFPGIYAWQPELPMIVKKKRKASSHVGVRRPCPWPSLRGDALKNLEEQLTVEQRKIWDKDENKRNKRSRQMVYEVGIFDRYISTMEVHLSYERTAQLRSFTGVYEHNPELECDL
jgi:hypothetical protein